MAAGNLRVGALNYLVAYAAFVGKVVEIVSHLASIQDIPAPF